MVDTSPSIHRELSEFFKFQVPGFQFMPAYKMRIWDGNIRLYNLMNGTLYVGLLQKLKEFCQSRKYNFEIDPKLEEKFSWKIEQAEEFYRKLGLPFEARDYQIAALHYAITNHRALLISPTGSGKSLIIYALTRIYNKKTLIIVPTISLVSQMWSDFRDYSENDNTFQVNKHCHPIYGGQDKNTNKQVVISTWQSIYKLPKSWFDKFEVVIGDEVHLFKAKSLTGIMNKLENAKYRFGTTGTLDGTLTHQLVLEGLFGQVFSVTSTKTLMDKKQLAELHIQCLILKYNEESSKIVSKLKYQDEIKFLIQHNKRNKFIRNLAISMKSNVMVLFQFVEAHGKILYDMISTKIKEKDPNRKVFFVFGGTDAEMREKVRAITEKETNAIIVASVGVFSTGINIRNLDNIIFASPTKSRIRVLQSIGRALRVGDYSNKAILYDIVDDLTYKAHKNFALKHFLERVKIYTGEKFKFKLHKIELELLNK